MSSKHPEECRCKYEEMLDASDPWYVNSKKHFNCFWNYIQDNERPHTLNEIANLLNLSISAITSIERKTLKKLQRKIRLLQNETKNK